MQAAILTLTTEVGRPASGLLRRRLWCIGAAAWGRGWPSEPRRRVALGGVARTGVDDQLQRACAPASAGSGFCGLYSIALADVSRRFFRSPPGCQWRDPARVDRGGGGGYVAWARAWHAPCCGVRCPEELCRLGGGRVMAPVLKQTEVGTTTRTG